MPSPGSSSAPRARCWRPSRWASSRAAGPRIGSPVRPIRPSRAPPVRLTGDEQPSGRAANQARGSWLASAAFPAPVLLAAAAAVVVAAAPWLSRAWRRAAWLALLLAAAARLLTGTILPAEVILALAAGGHRGRRGAG